MRLFGLGLRKNMMMRFLFTIFIVLIILLGVTFACLNAEPVSLNFYFGTRSLPLSMLLVLTLGLGLILGVLLFSLSYLRLKAKNIRLKSKIKLVEKEVENLRAIPLKDTH